MMLPQRLSKIGEAERSDHWHLPATAQCYFWGEYTPRGGYSYSETNQLIANFKKKMDRRDRPEWQHKLNAIQHIATAFSNAWKWDRLHQINQVMLVPIPPSRARSDEMYDPRMMTAIDLLMQKVALPLDIRDCLSLSGRYCASHETNDRPTPDELYAEMTFDADIGRPAQRPGLIFLFDDMLTTGAHYVAASRLLNEQFPGVEIVGQFIARRKPRNPFETSSS